MQLRSSKPVMEERGRACKLWRSSSLPASPRDVTSTTQARLTRASSFTARQSSSTTKNLFPATIAKGPSALLERRKRVNPALKVEAFNTTTTTTQSEPPASPSPSTSKPRTLYQVLQVSPFASQEEIKTAYWQSARKHHPDKVPLEHREAATLLFLEIHSAYSTLKDPLSRARYDLQMSLQSFQSSGYQSKSSSSSHSYTPRAQSTTPSSYRDTPRAQPSSTPSTTPRAQASNSPNLYPPRAQVSPSSNQYTPRGPSSSTNTYTPRSPYSIGRNWETDQCW